MKTIRLSEETWRIIRQLGLDWRMSAEQVVVELIAIMEEKDENNE